jgi:hypothetical protein
MVSASFNAPLRIADKIFLTPMAKEAAAQNGTIMSKSKSNHISVRSAVLAKRTSSPLKTGDVVEMTGMAPADDRQNEWTALKLSKRTVGCAARSTESVPGCNQTTARFWADWYYWVAASN